MFIKKVYLKRVGQVFLLARKTYFQSLLSKEEELKYLKEMEEGSVEAKTNL